MVKATRTGVILESLEDGLKVVIGGQSKVSVLKDITIYAYNDEGGLPLSEVLKRIHAHYQGEVEVTPKSDPAELFEFLDAAIPEFDKEKVYASDIKKLVTWYKAILVYDSKAFNPELEEVSEPLEEVSKPDAVETTEIPVENTSEPEETPTEEKKVPKKVKEPNSSNPEV